MRVGVIGDIHLGINEHRNAFFSYHLKCIEYIFKQFRKLGIKDIIYLGDIFDKRYSISVRALNQCRKLLQKNEFNQTFLVGNHDVTYKNSNKSNSLQLLLEDTNKVVVDHPEELEFGGKKFILVPWINKTNVEISTNIVNDSSADYLLGHLDLAGFELIRGFVSTTSSFHSSILKNFTHVISGHYHCYSNKKNITFLGNVCEMSWNDYNVDKFAGYMETDDDSFNLVPIPHKMYKVIRIKSEKDLIAPKKFKNMIVKCYLFTPRNIKIEKYITELVEICHQVNVIDEQVINATIDFDISQQNMSILDLWKAYISELEITKKDRKTIDKIFKFAYQKISIGDID